MVTLNVEDFGQHHGETVSKFTWRASDGFSVSVISYGATIQSIQVIDIIPFYGIANHFIK